MNNNEPSHKGPEVPNGKTLHELGLTVTSRTCLKEMKVGDRSYNTYLIVASDGNNYVTRADKDLLVTDREKVEYMVPANESPMDIDPTSVSKIIDGVKTSIDIERIGQDVYRGKITDDFRNKFIKYINPMVESSKSTRLEETEAVVMEYIKDVLSDARNALEAWKSQDIAPVSVDYQRKIAWDMVVSWGAIHRISATMLGDDGKALLATFDAVMEKQKVLQMAKLALPLIDTDSWMKEYEQFFEEYENGNCLELEAIRLLKTLDEMELVLRAREWCDNDDGDYSEPDYEAVPRVEECLIMAISAEDDVIWVGAAHWIYATVRAVTPEFDIENDPEAYTTKLMINDPRLAASMHSFHFLMPMVEEFMLDNEYIQK